MIAVTVCEVFNKRTGEPRTRYWLTEDPKIRVTGGPAALNSLCRKLMKLGLEGPAMVAWPDGKSSVLISDIAEAATWNLRECWKRGFSRERYRGPYPAAIREAA